MGKFKTPPDTGVAGKSKKSKKKASKDKLLKNSDSVAKDLDDMAAYDTATLDLSNATKSREALLQVIEMSKKQAQAMRAIMKENKELKAADTRGDRGAGRAPKSLNNPTFPDSCKFDPEQTDLSDINAFFSDFEVHAELVDTAYMLHTLRLRLSRDVRQLIKQINKARNTKSKAALNYKRTKRWLVKNYQRRDADDQLFRQLLQLKQGKMGMQSYFTKFQSKLDQLTERGHVLDAFTKRKYMLDGVHAHVRARAQELPEYYSMPESDLKSKLIALDSALVKPSAAARAVTQADVQSLIDTAVDKKMETVAAAFPHGGKGGGRAHDRGAHSAKRGQFSQGYMRKLYSAEQWAARMKCIEDKTPPSANPALYAKDCFPIVDGKPGPDSQPACVYCRNLGHTITTCKKFKIK